MLKKLLDGKSDVESASKVYLKDIFKSIKCCIDGSINRSEFRGNLSLDGYKGLAKKLFSLMQDIYVNIFKRMHVLDMLSLKSEYDKAKHIELAATMTSDCKMHYNSGHRVKTTVDGTVARMIQELEQELQ